jgi:diguanylate cyclase (GGDEF)-like protein
MERRPLTSSGIFDLRPRALVLSVRPDGRDAAVAHRDFGAAVVTHVGHVDPGDAVDAVRTEAASDNFDVLVLSAPTGAAAGDTLARLQPIALPIVVTVDGPLSEDEAVTLLLAGASEAVGEETSDVLFVGRLRAWALRSRHEQELRARLAAAEEQAAVDPLTGVLGRGQVEPRIDAAVAHVRRHGGQVALFMLDVDHFKRINDEHGHLLGDVALRELASALKKLVRGSDGIFRFGGDEFCALLVHAQPIDVHAFWARLQDTMQAASARAGVPLAISGGVVVYSGEEPRPAVELLAEADRNLLAAKKAGRGVLRPAPTKGSRLSMSQLKESLRTRFVRS